MTGIRRTASYVRKWGENTALVAKVAIQWPGFPLALLNFVDVQRAR
jgi:hypothetical protein